MPTSRKRKVPIVFTERIKSSKRRSSRAVIRQFHTLVKRKAQLEKLPASVSGHAIATQDIEEQLARLGGLEVYQQMSVLGQGSDRGGGSEKVLIEWLRSERAKEKKIPAKLRLLEVGTLKPDNYQHCSSWIEPTLIDLHPQHPKILERDFLLFDNRENYAQWDIVSLSLVLNFVADPKDRGHMLLTAHDILAIGGYLFIALPLPCIANSRYLDFDHLQDLMETVGFRELHRRCKPKGKMAYYLYIKEFRAIRSVERFQRKMRLREGNRNNFSILL